MLNKKNNYLKNISKIISAILLSFFIFNIFSINLTYAEKNEDTGLCAGKTEKDRYNCQVKSFCKIYKPKEPTFKTEDYFQIDKTWEESLFKNAKKIYRENQNSIYSCSIIKLQKNSYNLIKKKLLSNDKKWTIKARIDKKIDLKIKKLKAIEKQKKCSFPKNKEEWNSLQSKHLLLNESAYEYCKYSFYLDFLQNHYKNINNANQEYLWKKKEHNSYKIGKIAKIQSKLQQDLIAEKEHSAKVFDMAFNTYIDYENNFPVHILLQLIKEDFIVLRRKLHEAISPINQVVYKISNAMSIN